MHVGHPSNEVRQSLANQLQMTPKSVQVWFQNRRQKLRGQQQAMAMASSSEPSAAVHPVMVQRQIDAVQQQVDDAGRREAVRPYPLQATRTGYQAAAGAAAVMHTVQGYPLPRPGDFQTTTLPAHILSELASVSAAEQDLAHLTRQLMQRKVELLDNIQRLEQQSAASRHGGHAVSLSPAYLATQAATMDFAAYKKYKETNEPFRASEPLQVPRPAPPCNPSPLRAHSEHPRPSCRLGGPRVSAAYAPSLPLAGARGAGPVGGLFRFRLGLALRAVRLTTDRLGGRLAGGDATARLANARR